MPTRSRFFDKCFTACMRLNATKYSDIDRYDSMTTLLGSPSSHARLMPLRSHRKVSLAKKDQRIDKVRYQIYKLASPPPKNVQHHHCGASSSCSQKGKHKGNTSNSQVSNSCNAATLLAGGQSAEISPERLVLHAYIPTRVSAPGICSLARSRSAMYPSTP